VDSSIALVGDFNFPTIDWNNLQFSADRDRCSTLFSMFSKQFCFDQLVTEPTRIHTTGNSSLLDLILCNDPFIVSDIIVCEPFSTSDHCSINFSLIYPSQSANLPTHDFRNFAEADWNAITVFLNNCDWACVFNNCTTADECAAAFYSKLNEAINCYIPLEKFKSVKPSKHYLYPPHIRKLNRAKAAAWKRYKYFKTDQLRREYKDISSRVRKSIYGHVVKREQTILDSGNLGKFYRYANSKFTHKSSIGPLQDADGNKTIDPQVKAELLSKYFQSQFTTDNNVQPGMQPRIVNSSISSVTFTPVLIKRIISKLNARSAGGPDGIPPSFFKHTCQAICQPLAFLFRVLFDEGCLPSIWRQAYITSIYKKGDCSLACNYRPLSHLLHV
jgi:hypothetical protein